MDKPLRFLDPFTAVLLDMNGTFMFEQDRFGPKQHYATSYRKLGGITLSDDEVMAAMQTAHAAVLYDYDQPERFTAFPTMREIFRQHTQVPEDELARMDEVFAAHEIGVVPASHARFLRTLAKSHTLGIVSNICAQPGPWLSRLQQCGLREIFKTVVFSSEGRDIKPSPAIFGRALSQLPPKARVLFVGDSLERDILPAKALGLGTAWIAPLGSRHEAADVVVEQLPDLANV